MNNIDYSNKTKPQLEKILDEWFSIYIRMSNADEYGMCTCCTCGKREHWKKMDAGHYVKRGHSATRFVEQNVAPQCHFDNRQRYGEEQAHRIYIDNKYGEGTSAFLRKKGKLPFTMTKEEYIEKIIYYRTKIEELKKWYC